MRWLQLGLAAVLLLALVLWASWATWAAYDDSDGSASAPTVSPLQMERCKGALDYRVKIIGLGRPVFYKAGRDLLAAAEAEIDRYC